MQVQGNSQGETENIPPTQLSRQLTSSKWIAAAEFMKDQSCQTALMTVATFYDHKGRDIVFAMAKNKQGLCTGSFTVPHGLNVVHTYGPREYRQWIRKKVREDTKKETQG